MIKNPKQKVSGITLAHISDEAPRGYLEKNGFLGALERMYLTAQACFERQKFKPEERGLLDERAAQLVLGDDEDYNSPSYAFLITKGLIDKIKTATTKKGSDLSQDELLKVCLMDGEGAVNPDFAFDALNAISVSYYSSDIAFDKSTKLANMYVKNAQINIALGSLMSSKVGKQKKMRIKELASGGETGHWRYIAKSLKAQGVSELDVELTDLITPPLSDLSKAKFNVHAAQYSLFDTMPDLPKDERFNVMISTYGFDSVWLPEDMSLRRIGDRWYRLAYRVKVAEWNERREELILALRQGRALPNAKATDYDGIFVESAMEEIDIEKHQFAKYILKRDGTTLNFPGGLIKRLVNIFDAQLDEGGVFIDCDVGSFGFPDQEPVIADYSISGVAARFKLEDFVLAKEILEEEYGLHVLLLPLGDLIWKYAPEQLAKVGPIIGAPQNGIMVVSRH